MAIVKMKRLRVIAMADRRQALLDEMLRMGCVEISEPEARLRDPQWAAIMQPGSSRLAETRTELAAVNTALVAMKRYGELKDGLFVQRKPISEAEFLGPDLAEKAQALNQKVSQSLEILSGLQMEENRMNSRVASLEPWKTLDMPLELTGTKHAIFRPGSCPAKTDVGALTSRLSAVGAEFYTISQDKLQLYGLAVFHRNDEEAAQEVLREFGFSVVAFQGTTGTAAENIRALDAALAENKKAQQVEMDNIGQLGQQRDLLRAYADRLQAEVDREAGASRLLSAGSVVFFEGWVPAESLSRLEQLLQKEGCAWESADPVEDEYPNVPVQLKNNWLTRPLSMVTEMYSLPAYGHVDPNPLMAPFFIPFYGIMLADMGYGLLMIIAGLLISKKYHPKGTAGNLFNLMTLCGIMTFIMGILTGGFFGDFLTQLVKLTTGGDFALPSLFSPLDDVLMVLIGAMCLGVIHIITGMAISVVLKAKRGEYMDIFWNELTWWIVFVGIALAVLGITMIVLYVGIALVILGPIVTGKGFGKITGIFGSLYNNVTGFGGDILSYSRLMALMLAGSVIAQVFNTLGAIPGNIVVFIVVALIGNALNFALNLLGCYVHDLRLQCLEYFGKFYEDGGKPFKPMAIRTKYVDVK